MPRYYYLCDDCGFEFDRVNELDEKRNVERCPHCQTFTGKVLDSPPKGEQLEFPFMRKKNSA